MAENLKSCLSSVQPIYHILSVPLKSTITLEDIKKAFSLFPPGSDLSKVTDFDGILCEINILRLNTDNDYNNTLKSIMEPSNKLKTVIPSANALCRLAYTSPVSTATKERVFSILKFVKNHLRTTMTDERLDNLMVLNSSKDILDEIDMTTMIESWATLKE
ncbi:unnamed protein product [Macrosiphum euphorbiae]|uniref:HAT C-terminal dimerisation domain-containing protein n=1 Tax=Macrosiphum euphorbiae TaxID=13131 RepID=A0AAV0WAP4_9HEMI|nr:unnamed protein product [Macrosiphum euphorbiae]